MAHPLGPKQSGGRRRSDFLVSRGMTPQAAGEESRAFAVAPQAVEASADLRLDQPIEEAVRCARSEQRRTRENAATLLPPPVTLTITSGAPRTVRRICSIWCLPKDAGPRGPARPPAARPVRQSRGPLLQPAPGRQGREGVHHPQVSDDAPGRQHTELDRGRRPPLGQCGSSASASPYR